MNLSLKNRIAGSFIVANLVVLVMGFTVFFFLNDMNKKMIKIQEENTRFEKLGEEIKDQVFNLLEYQRAFVSGQANMDTLNNVALTTGALLSQLQRLDTIVEEVNFKTSLSKLVGKVEYMRSQIEGLYGPKNKDRSNYLAFMTNSTNEVFGAFKPFQKELQKWSQSKQEILTNITSETRRNMLIVLIITFLGTILLSLVIPGKIALPFKKINDAIREIQECNFDVSIYYSQSDEIGELAGELNKMLQNIKRFEELRTDRISIENRKFDILANLSHKNILICNSIGELVYLNNTTYKLLEIDTDEILHKNFNDVTRLPECIKEAFEVAIKRRSKIENEEIVIHEKEVKEILGEDGAPLESINEEDDSEELTKVKFKGFATIFPIRAKDSAQDFYMMIISTEVFA
jgi:nitrogen fixation/metabolism regulation signal transduction histidine kinase